MPGKRSDPRKLRREAEQIIQDREKREHVPQPDRQYPNLIERGRRVVESVGKFIDERQKARSQRKYPPARRSGAEVIGRKEGDRSA